MLLCAVFYMFVAGSARAMTDNNRCVAIDSLCARQHGLSIWDDADGVQAHREQVRVVEGQA
jgi:hypothetical protein